MRLPNFQSGPFSALVGGGNLTRTGIAANDRLRVILLRGARSKCGLFGLYVFTFDPSL